MAKILLIEDDPDDTLLLQEMFSPRCGIAGFDIVCENRLEKGLKRLAEEKMDLIAGDLFH